MFWIRLILLVISFLGYFLFLNRKVDMAIIPIVTFSSIGVIMFIAGLLNIMVAVTYLLVFVGAILFFWLKPWKFSWNNEAKRSLLIIGCFGVLCMLSAGRLYGNIPIHYDEFSHWLLVIKDMIYNNHMPNFQSNLITFKGYPTGSAGFIYFFCKFLEVSRDDFLVFVQSLLIISALLSLLSFIKKVKFFSILIFLICSIFCLVANIPITELLVDTLISVIAISVVIVGTYYRYNPRKVFFLSLPMQIFLVTIKNSGLLMMGINGIIMFLILLYTHHPEGKLSFKSAGKICKYCVGSILIPILVYYLWLQHVEYVFNDGALSKHTASIANYTSVLGEKTISQVNEIIHIFMGRMFSWNHAWVYLIIFFIIVGLGSWYRKNILKDGRRFDFVIMGVVIAIYVLFMAVLGAMYLFSMPYEEAVVLASYERYEYTILVYLVGMIAVYLLNLFQLTVKHSKNGTIVPIIIVIMFSGILVGQVDKIQTLFVKTNEYLNSDRYLIEEMKEHYNIPDESSYMIVGDSIANDSGYHYYLARYIFRSENVGVCEPRMLDTGVLKQKYLIILDENKKVDKFLLENGYTLGEKVYVMN